MGSTHDVRHAHTHTHTHTRKRTHTQTQTYTDPGMHYVYSSHTQIHHGYRPQRFSSIHVPRLPTFSTNYKQDPSPPMYHVCLKNLPYTFPSRMSCKMEYNCLKSFTVSYSFISLNRRLLLSTSILPRAERWYRCSELGM